MIKSIKELIQKAANKIAEIWREKIAPFFRRVYSYFKNVVFIDGDMYLASKSEDGKQQRIPKFFSLYFGLIGSVLIGIFLAIMIYLGMRLSSDFYIKAIYNSEAKKAEREEQVLEELQSFVNKKGITNAENKDLQDRIDDQSHIFISVYDGDALASSSLDNTEGGALSDERKTEILEKVTLLTNTATITTQSGTTLLIKVYDYSEYFYRDLFTMLSLLISLILFALVILEHFSKIIMRIKRLQRDVNEVTKGHMNHEIVATGFDEVTKLSYDVDNMRLSMLENVKKEREALEMNTELITSMSHDIRTPLTILMGYVDIMKSGLPPDEMDEYVLACEKTVLRLKKLSDDMFKYFRAYGRGGEGITMEEYNAPILFEQMLSEHVLLLKEGGYKVDYDIEPLIKEDLIVRTDAPHLMRIIDNIFSNIIKYADKENTVLIKGSREGDLAVFEFSNKIAKSPHAESSKVGLKTCKRISEYILNTFDYGADEDTFTLTFSLKLYDTETKIAESFIIR